MGTRAGVTINGVQTKLARLLATGQSTTYAAGDDADVAAGIAKSYQVLTTGQYSGTSNIDVPTYAAATISFDETGGVFTVADSANGLALIKTGDVITILGSALNDGTYTVAAGDNAASFTTVGALVDEAAGAYVTLSKRADHSNNTVLDLNTGLQWLRDGSNYPAKTGATSAGALLWTATACVLHAAGADLQILSPSKGSATLKIVGGAGEIARYHVGHGIVLTGFATATNNLPGFKITSVTVNGADLDIVIATGNLTLTAEAAAGSRTISVPCNGIWSFCEAANLAAVGGFSDWRVPDENEYKSLSNSATGALDATAFPNATNPHWTSTTTRSATTSANYMQFKSTTIASAAKTGPAYLMLVRGGL